MYGIMPKVNLHTAQVVNKQRDMKKNYMAVYHADRNKVVQLATAEMPEVQLADKGDGAKAVALRRTCLMSLSRCGRATLRE